MGSQQNPKICRVENRLSGSKQGHREKWEATAVAQGRGVWGVDQTGETRRGGQIPVKSRRFQPATQGLEVSSEGDSRQEVVRNVFQHF